MVIWLITGILGVRFQVCLVLMLELLPLQQAVIIWS